MTNMMMVNVSERYREIGIRKAVGASDLSIRMLFLTEAIVICLVAGIVVATKFIKKIQFEWIFNFWAIFLSISSIIIVGLLSGLLPALKAEKLQIIEALRAE